MKVLVKKVQDKDTWWCDFKGFRIVVKQSNNKFNASVFSKNFQTWTHSENTLEGVIQTCVQSIANS